MSTTSATGVYERKVFGPGRLLIRPGSEAKSAYLVQSGRALVFALDAGVRIPLAEIAAGDIVGDMALIRKSHHRHGVEAITTVVAVLITPGRLQKALDEADPLLKTILDGMLRRIDRLNHEKRQDQFWMA